jgi:hypothetical protein
MIKTCVKRFRATAGDLRAALAGAVPDASPNATDTLFYEDKVGELGGGAVAPEPEPELTAASVRATASKLGLVGRFVDLTELFAFRVASLGKAAAQRGPERVSRGDRGSAVKRRASNGAGDEGETHDADPADHDAFLAALTATAREEGGVSEEEEEEEDGEGVYYYDPLNLEDGEDGGDMQLNLNF